MTTAKINTVELQKAIKKFGSLQRAIEVLKSREERLTAAVLALEEDLDAKKDVKKSDRNELKRLNESIDESTDKLNGILENINKYEHQYRLFESFIAMLLTSPSKEGRLEELTTEIIAWSQVIWRTDWPVEKLRWVFVRTVLGEYLHCYCCVGCGAKFIVNKGPKSNILGCTCPICAVPLHTMADESFLEVMLGSYRTGSTENQ